MTQFSVNQLNVAYTQLKQCPYLGHLVKQHGKCKLDPLVRDPFEESVISQKQALH